jgi:hypothetical protein
VRMTTVTVTAKAGGAFSWIHKPAKGGFVPLDGVGRPHGRAHIRKDCLDRVQSDVEGRALPIPGEAPRRP